MEVLTRWLERGDSRVYALVRAEDDEAAAERLRPGLDSAFGPLDANVDRLTAVAGDVQEPGLGFAPERADQLAREVDVMVHSAASVSFTLGLDESREINVEGTRNALDFAERCRRVERLVQGRRRRLPVQVLRPSIIVGERHSGWTSSFNVLYGPLKAFARGNFPAVPARESAPVDVVPVDYVADATYELSSRGPNGTFHLVAGRHATSVGRLIELASRHFRRKPPSTFPPAVYRRVIYPLALSRLGGRARKALRKAEVFFPYFSMRVRYDDRRARERLEPAGIRVTPVESYFQRLLDFAQAADWGRQALSRREARASSQQRRK